eukprot:m.1116883 g.1116883  ORF g.1116883 m.1116883 type:complete len:1270 (+) comp24380_c0_seq5:314-4123(+)
MFQSHHPDAVGMYQQKELPRHSRKIVIMDTTPVKRNELSESNTLERAHEFYSAGNFVEARNAAQSILTKDPGDTSANLLLAAIEFGSDNPVRALEINTKVGQQKEIRENAIAEHYASGYMEMASQLFQKGDVLRAEHAFRCVLAINPTKYTAWNDLGNLLKQQCRLAESRHCYDEALKLNPQLAVAWNNLGCANLDEGDAQTAVLHFIKAVYFDPKLDCVYSNLTGTLGPQGQSVSLNHLGDAMRDENRFEDAVTVFTKSLQIFNSASMQASLAIVYHRQHMLREAAYHYNEALRLHPQFVECHSNLGHVLRDLGDLNGARMSFHNAVQLNPCSADDYNHLACVCKDLGIIHEAIAYYQMSMGLKADNPNVFCNLVHSLKMVCDWSKNAEYIPKLVALVTQQIEMGNFPSVHPHHTFLYPLTNEVRLKIGAAHAKAAIANVAPAQKLPYNFNHLLQTGVASQKARKNSRRLRVGYVSSDFKDHPTAHLMQSIPGFHDRSRVEVFCYSLAADDNSHYRKKIEAEAEHFVDVSGIPDNFAVADMIYAAGIDILINLNGYTKGARTEIFALRPAPIQVMWLGYPGTSGASFMDYIISDPITTPRHLRDAFSEKVVSLPSTFFCSDHKFSHPLKPQQHVMPKARPASHALSSAHNGQLLQGALASGGGHGPSTIYPPSMPGGTINSAYFDQKTGKMHCSTSPRIGGVPNSVPTDTDGGGADHSVGGTTFNIPYVNTNYIVPGAGFQTAFLPTAPYVQPEPLLSQTPVIAISAYNNMMGLNPHAAGQLLDPRRSHHHPSGDYYLYTPWANPNAALSAATYYGTSIAAGTVVHHGSDAGVHGDSYLHGMGQHGYPRGMGTLEPSTAATGLHHGHGTQSSGVLSDPLGSNVQAGNAVGGDAAQRQGMPALADVLSVPGMQQATPQSVRTQVELSAQQHQTSAFAASSAHGMLPMQHMATLPGASLAPQDYVCYNMAASVPLAASTLPQSNSLLAFASNGGLPQHVGVSIQSNGHIHGSVGDMMSRAAAAALQPATIPVMQEPEHCPLPNPNNPEPQPPISRMYYGLPEDAIVFCNFNQLYKLDEELFRCWMRILRRAPKAVLWLLRFPAAGEANVLNEAQKCGVDPRRVIFSHLANKTEHIRRGSLADVCLDTALCNGHTTGMDVLWAGTPMLTLPGETLASRVASSQLATFGFPELICASQKEYEDKAVQYATNPALLHSLQHRVRQARYTSPLFDTRLVARNLEKAFFAMHKRFEHQLAPDHIMIGNDEEQLDR